MTSFLHALLGISVTGGIFILAAVLIRTGVKNRLPKRFLTLLWGAVLVHLLLVTGASSPTSIYNHIGLRAPAALDVGQPAGSPFSPEWDKSTPVAQSGSVEAAFAPGSEGAQLAAVAFSVWLIGAVTLGMVCLWCNWTTRNRFAEAILLRANPTVERWRQGKKNSIKVYVSDRTPTPISCGLLKPRIILPSDFDMRNASQLESVLEHEYIHGSNYHNVMKFLVGAAVVVHWFNPLVWLFWILFNHDVELVCDEQVLRNLGAKRRAEYAHSLVAVAERVTVGQPLVSAFNARNLRERIVDVMGFKPTSRYWLIPEILLVAMLYALFGTHSATGGSPTPAPKAVLHQETLPIPPELIEWKYPQGVDEQSAALSLVGGGTVIKSEIDGKRAKELVEFKIVSEDRVYTIKLDPNTRSLVKYERKALKKTLVPNDLSPYISAERAKEIALQTLGEGRVVGMEFKQSKSGAFKYEVTVVKANKKYEVELDALHGNVLEVDD